MSKVIIIVPVLNNVFFTKQLWKSIEFHETIHSLDAIFVDNASTDGTKEFLDRPIQKVIRGVITNEKNVGFGPAVNQGIRLALKTWPDAHVLVMNNDMELEPGCIDALVKTLDGVKDAGIVGGKLLFPDGTIQHAGALIGPYGWGQHMGGGVADKDYADTTGPLEVEYTTGALFLIRNELLQVLPGFDEQFAPAYFEEVDFCYSARQLGWKTYYTPDARAIHYENQTGKQIYSGDMDKVNQLSRINQTKFYLKHDEDPYVPTSKDQLLIVSQIYGAWSFTHVMRNLAKGLSHAGVDVAIAPEEYHQTMPMDDWEVRQMILKPHDYVNRAVLRSSEGDHLYLMPPGKKRIAHTTGESSRISRRWRDQLNMVDQVLTTSTFFRNIMLEGGVKTPIDVLPNSVDTKVWTPKGPKLPIGGLRGFNFVSTFHWGDRKNPAALVRAFANEFQPDEDVTLTIHSLSMAFVLDQRKMTSTQWLNAVIGDRYHAPVLVTSSEWFSPRHLPQLMRNFDVFVTATRAEGFCLPLLESAALGIPAIATGYSGLTDILTEATGWRVNYDLVPIPLQVLPYYQNFIGGYWAEINQQDLQAKMRYAFEHRGEVHTKGQAARANAQHYDIDEIGKLARKLIFDKE